MKKQFIPYEQALKLKELGFDEPCFAYFNFEWNLHNDILFPQHGGESNNWNTQSNLTSAPLWQQAFDWFRKEHSLDSSIVSYREFDKVEYSYNIPFEDFDEIFFDTYQEAQLSCLDKLIEIVKNK